MDKLLPCPFCNSEAVHGQDDDGYQWIGCTSPDCGIRTLARTEQMERRRPILRDQWNTRHTPEGWAMAPAEATREQESKAEDYWQSKRFAAFSDDPRTWAGVYQTMLSAAPKWGGG